jgi:hypothetical protein
MVVSRLVPEILSLVSQGSMSTFRSMSMAVLEGMAPPEAPSPDEVLPEARNLHVCSILAANEKGALPLSGYAP